MLKVVEKGYWKPSPETLAELRKAQTDLAPAVEAENATIAKRADLQPAPGSVPGKISSHTASSKIALPNIVKGQVLEEKVSRRHHTPPPPRSLLRTSLVGLAALGLILIGWWKR
jgi:cobalamin biosynthesis Mg chelatase CobN